MKTIQANEVFLGNTNSTEIPEQYRSLKSIRLGEQAFDINGKPLSKNHYRPLIISKTEEAAYDKIYGARMSDARYKKD
jgi:hypothetical protein